MKFVLVSVVWLSPKQPACIVIISSELWLLEELQKTKDGQLLLQLLATKLSASDKIKG
jgi:hypothetical protein